MALIIEDGTGKPDASSYATVQDLRTYAEARGVNLPAEDAATEIFLIKGMDYIESKDARFTGRRATTTQALSWPRECGRIGGQPWPDDQIPRSLVLAQLAAGVEVSKGSDLMPSSDGKIVKRRKTDVLETEYAVGADFRDVSGLLSASFPSIDAHLEPLMVRSASRLRTVRV